MEKFYRIPFAFSGDKTAVPDNTQPSGSVSYEQGFGPDYELDPATNPSAKDVPRDETNQLFASVTTAIRELQIFYAPDFITTALNGGSPFSYAKYARVKYTDGVVYESRVDSNTSLPTDATKWRAVTDTSSVLVIEAATFEASVSNGEAVYWDAANGRFDEAVADGSSLQLMVGFADVTNSRVILAGDITGIFSGLTAGARYYLSTTVAGAITATRPVANAVSVGIARGTNSLFVSVELAQPAASETVPGLVELASDAEAQAYTANKFIDGQKMAKALQGPNQSLLANGYQKLPGGLILQWGTNATSGGSVAVTFPIAFPNGVLCAPIIQAVANSAQWYSWAAGNVTNSGFSAYCGVSYSNGVFGSGSFTWFCIGH